MKKKSKVPFEIKNQTTLMFNWKAKPWCGGMPKIRGLGWCNNWGQPRTFRMILVGFKHCENMRWRLTWTFLAYMQAMLGELLEFAAQFSKCIPNCYANWEENFKKFHKHFLHILEFCVETVIQRLSVHTLEKLCTHWWWINDRHI